jgi:hypothetical protein
MLEFFLCSLAAVELARGQVVEIETQFKIAESDLAAMSGLVRQAGFSQLTAQVIRPGKLSFLNSAYLHMVDAVGVVHAIILRIQTLVMPVKMLVFSGH